MNHRENLNNDIPIFPRRAFLRTSTMGLGAMALSSLLNESGAQDAKPLRRRPGHRPAMAQVVRST
jgi:hypothetical protein